MQRYYLMIDTFQKLLNPKLIDRAVGHQQLPQIDKALLYQPCLNATSG